MKYTQGCHIVAQQVRQKKNKSQVSHGSKCGVSLPSLFREAG